MTTRETTEQKIRRILRDEFASLLADVDWRINQARQMAASPDPAGRQVFAEDLNLSRHLLTGYGIANNAPTAGKIAWTNVHMVYNGADTAITDANTDKRYAWWSPTTTPTQLQTSDTKPVLAAGEVLVLINNGGTAVVALSDTNTSLPQTLSNGAVDSGAILAGAVGSQALASKAVGSGQLADGAVGATQLGAGAVVSGKIADGAVASANIANGAVGATQIGAGAVGGTQLADGAVGTTKLGAGAVTSSTIATGAVGGGQLAANAVDASKIADGSVTGGKIAAGAVGTSQIGAGSVDGTKLANGAVSAAKLNIMSHVLY